MSSKHLIDPELIPGLEYLPTTALTQENLPGFRQSLTEMFKLKDPPLDDTSVIRKAEVFIPGPAGCPDVRVLTFTHIDSKTDRPAYFHIHGGGFVLGSADQSEDQCSTIAKQLDCVVASVDYRLAPETTFPGNIEDCYTGLKWFHSQAKELGADPNRLSLGGESAGGGLAASLALLARDRGEVPIIHQQLVYPMLDDREPPESHPYTGEFGWTRESNHFGWQSLLGSEPGGDDVSPYAAAARATNLEGLPPAFISVGSLDLFLEQNLEYARRLTRAGVPVELHVYPGAYHGSDVVATARISKLHKRDQLAALQGALWSNQ